MMITKAALPRRTFLRAAGATVALPWLDAMAPALSARAGDRPLRVGFIYLPSGQALVNWIPKQTGKDYEMTRILKPAEAFRDQLLVISGCSNTAAMSQEVTTGPHTRCGSTWLNGVPPKRTEGADILAGKTLDQYAADVMGVDTPLRSLEMALESNYNVGNCDVGYSCTYVNTFSWRTPTVPLPMEDNPRLIFERLFGTGGTAADRARQMREGRSILDGVLHEMSRLEKGLGPQDRATLNEYVDSVRDVESRIQRAEKQSASSPGAPMAQPVGIPSVYDDFAKLMYDLMFLAYQADITRVVAFQIAREQSGQTYPWIGVPQTDHNTSHHGTNAEMTEQRTRINTYHASLFAGFLQKMRATQDGDGTLLDRAMILYGSGMGDGNVHSPLNVPLLLAGGANGRLKSGRHLAAKMDTPIMNLGLSLLDIAGVRLDSVGDSTERLLGL